MGTLNRRFKWSYPGHCTEEGISFFSFLLVLDETHVDDEDGRSGNEVFVKLSFICKAREHERGRHRGFGSVLREEFFESGAVFVGGVTVRVGRDEDSEDWSPAVLDFVDESPERREDGMLGGVTGVLDLVLGRIPGDVLDEMSGAVFVGGVTVRVGPSEDSEDWSAAVLDFVDEDPERREDRMLGGSLGGVTGVLDLVLG